MEKQLSKIKVFLEMIKFEHSIFALPFAYLGLFLGEHAQGHWPRPHLFFGVTVAMVSFRTMGMALNRIIDSHIDGRNPRTKNRALPAGKLKISFVWLATAVSFFVFEASAWLLGPLCFLLSPIPVFFAVLYPWMKRFTWLSHVVLGIILGIAPYGAWLASQRSFSWIPGLLSLGVICWVTGFDMIYALQDIDFDRQSGLYSFPARFGYDASLFTTRILHVLTVAAWIFLGKLAGLGIVYFLGMGIVIFFLVREHWLVWSFGLQKLNEAFFTMNAVVSLSVFLATVIDFSLGKI